MTLRRALTIVFFAALGIAAVRDIARMGEDLPWHVMYDFQDFYCAGTALDRGQSPYTYEPLHSCEHTVDRNTVFALQPALAIPAPQPPYDFLLFMALARVDFAAARAIYAFCIVVSVLLAAVILSRLEIAFDLALAALALSTGFQELNAGQIVPFVLLLLILTGWMLAQRLDRLAGILAALTAIEPHVSVSVLLSVLLFVPRARSSAIVTSILLVVSGVALAGTARFASYITQVLPAQASAEARFPYQYSLTYLLHYVGVPDAPALWLGSLSFIAFLVAGLWLAPRVAAQLQRRELLVFFPAATAIMAGAYVHMVELCFAIPAALVMARWTRGTLRIVSAATLCVLSVPWIPAWSVKKLFLASTFVCAAVIYRLRIPSIAGVAIAAAIAGSLYFLELHPPVLPTPALQLAFPAGALVQVEWRAMVNGLDTHNPFWLLVKLPAWCALAALLLTAIATARLQSPGASESSRESSHEAPYPGMASLRVRTGSSADPR